MFIIYKWTVDYSIAMFFLTEGSPRAIRIDSRRTAAHRWSTRQPLAPRS